MMPRFLLFALGLLQIPAVGCAQTKGSQNSFPADTAPLFLDEWNAYAPGRPTFQHPMSLAADPEGNVFLLGQGKVLRFTTDGAFVMSWKVPFPFLHRPEIPLTLNAIAASKDAVYVSDPAAACIHRFTPEGKHKGTISFVAGLNGLAVDPLGNLYVSGIHVLESDTVKSHPDTLLGVIAQEGPALWKLNRLGDVLNRWDRKTGPLAVDHQGTLFAVTEIYTEGPVSILRLDPAGGRISEWEIAKLPQLPSSLVIVNALGVDPQGHVFLTVLSRAEREDQTPSGKGSVLKRAIVELDEKGNWTRDWTSAGPDRRPIVEPTGVAVDTSGCLYVTDWAVSRVVKYDPRKAP